jgi:hypothetical protein
MSVPNSHIGQLSKITKKFNVCAYVYVASWLGSNAVAVRPRWRAAAALIAVPHAEPQQDIPQLDIWP